MRKDYHVLHIDDDPFIRQIVRHTLETDFTVTTCSHGIEAIDWLEQGNYPDIILTDLKMPDFDGMELINMVKSSSLHQGVPIFVLAATNDSDLKISCLDNGADDFIDKPFNPLFVKAKIRALMRRLAERRNFHPGFVGNQSDFRR